MIYQPFIGKCIQLLCNQLNKYKFTGVKPEDILYYK